MPRTKTDYSNTIIYKIVCNDLNITDCYVGHTTNFRHRKSQHKCTCNNEKNKDYNLKIYKTIRDNGGWWKWSMIEIEKFSCVDGNEARARERYWFEILNGNMNGNYPNRAQKEYIDTHQEQIKQYNEKNKDYIKERNKQYKLDHKDEIKKRQKQYREEHKESETDRRKKYREENRDELNKRQREQRALKKQQMEGTN